MSSTDPHEGGDAVQAPPVTKLDRRKQVIAGVLTVAVLAFVFFGVFPKFANYSQAWDSIQKMSVAAVAALLVAALVNIVVYVFPYQAALPGLPYGKGFVVRQTSFMISNAIPAGGAFGLGVQYTMLSGYGFGPAATSSAIAATSVWNLLVTLGLPALGVLAIVFQGGATTSEVLGAIGGIVAIGVMVGLLILVLRSEVTARRVGELGDRLAAPLIAKVNKRRGVADQGSASESEDGDGQVTKAVIHFRDNLRGVVEDRWGLLTITSILQQLCQFAILAVAFFGLTGTSGGINLVQLFAAFAIARLAGFIPITPGGLGTVDAAMVGMMASMGADRDTALAATLLWRAASFIPQVVLGIITFLIWRKQAHSKGPRDVVEAAAAN
ncbi:MAG: YbhN family protein [Microthrixaceae bacterium]